ncbi:MAG: hypothetical protein ACOY93_06710, partial [Bacillota bacterium]
SNPRSPARQPPPAWRSSPSFAERGYALPLVLVAIAVFLIYAAEASARVVREARVAKVKGNAEIAYYAAEAGFNWARARLIGGADEPTMLALHGHTETFVDMMGNEGGSYSIEITPIDAANGVYHISSTGTFGTGLYQATRRVSGTVSWINPTGTIPRAVHTAYD